MKDNICIKTSNKEEYGLFALIFQVVSLLIKGKEVYVDFEDRTAYYDKEKGLNSWEYYFEQPCGNLKTLYEKIVMGEISNYKSDDFELCNHISLGDKILERSKKALEEIRAIINEKIRIKIHIKQKIDSFYDDNFKGYKILGIQKRGTDSYYLGHATELFDIEYAFKEINNKINDYDKLFLITDEIPTLELFRKRYSDKLIHYDNASLSPHEAAIHRGGSTDCKYKLGEDVLIETELLSKVDYLLAMNSNLSLWAILKGNMPYNFIDTHIKYIV